MIQKAYNTIGSVRQIRFIFKVMFYLAMAYVVKELLFNRNMYHFVRFYMKI